MVFESPGYTCVDEDEETCTQAIRWDWVPSTETHGYEVSETPTLIVREVRADYTAIHEFGHAFGMPDYYQGVGMSNWDSRLSDSSIIAMMNQGFGNITAQDTDQLEAIYFRHTSH